MDIYTVLLVAKNNTLYDTIGIYTSQDLAFEAIKCHSKLHEFTLDEKPYCMYEYTYYHSNIGFYQIFCKQLNAVPEQ